MGLEAPVDWRSVCLFVERGHRKSCDYALTNSDC